MSVEDYTILYLQVKRLFEYEFTIVLLFYRFSYIIIGTSKDESIWHDLIGKWRGTIKQTTIQQSKFSSFSYLYFYIFYLN